jgi:hypothetical protein
MADHFIPPQGRRTIRQRHGLSAPGNPVVPAGGRENRSIPMWGLGEGAPGSSKEKLRRAYLDALVAVDKIEAHRAEAMASGKLTPAGVNDDTLKFAASQLAPAFKRGRHVIDAAKAEAKALRAKIQLERADKSDVVGFLRRQEMRRHLLEMDDKKRNQFISHNRESLEPDMALAIVEMPAAFSGVLESDRNGLIDTALQAQHGQAMTDLRDLEQAIEIAESAVETGRDEVRQQTGADQETFDKQAASFDQNETPWLKRMTENGEEVVRVVRWDWAKGGMTGTGALPTPKDLETGKFFKDRAEYNAANHEWLKHRDATA